MISWILILTGMSVLWLVFRKGGAAPKVILLLGFVLLVLVASISQRRWGSVVPLSSGELPLVAAGQREAIDLSGRFKTVEGREASLTEYQGKVLFLNVWATWCPPCRSEMPHMADLYRRLSKSGLSMVAVTSEDEQTVREFLDEHPYPFTILLDPDDVLSRRFGINSIPTTFVVDEQGRLIYRHRGYNQWSSPATVQWFEQLLNQ